MNSHQIQARWKRAISFSFAALLCMAPSVAECQDYQYTTTNGVIKITRYTGPGGDVTIPSSMDGLPVTIIGNLAFMDCTNLTSITIPDNVVEIENGFSIFWGGIHAGSFWGCLNLTMATIGNGVTNIGNYAFNQCGALTTVTIGASVRHIPDVAFSGCTSLQEMNVAPINTTFSSFDGVLFNKDQTTLIRYPVGSLEPSYSVPDSVTMIGANAFSWGCTHLTTVTLGNRVTNISAAAFWGCDHLTQLRIPDSVTRVERAAFRDCTELTDVGIGNGVTDIGDDAFSGCSKLTQVLIPDNVLSLGVAFRGCRSLTNVVLGNGVTAIIGRSCGTWGGIGGPPDTGTFSDCSSLNRITIGKGVMNIQNEAFARCDSLTNVTIPQSVAVVENGAFAGCTNLAGVFFEGPPPAVIDRCVPSLDEHSVFAGSPKVVVYYLPDTAGWGPTFSKRRTALWNPRIDTGTPAFGMRTAGFGLPITGTANIPIVLEASTNLGSQSWSPLLSCTLTNGSLEFQDSQWLAHPNRYYRIRSP